MIIKSGTILEIESINPWCFDYCLENDRLAKFHLTQHETVIYLETYDWTHPWSHKVFLIRTGQFVLISNEVLNDAKQKLKKEIENELDSYK